MEMVDVTLGLSTLGMTQFPSISFVLGWIKYWFPEFEFSWLAVRSKFYLFHRAKKTTSFERMK